MKRSRARHVVTVKADQCTNSVGVNVCCVCRNKVHSTYSLLREASKLTLELLHDVVKKQKIDRPLEIFWCCFCRHITALGHPAASSWYFNRRTVHFFCHFRGFFKNLPHSSSDDRASLSADFTWLIILYPCMTSSSEPCSLTLKPLTYPKMWIKTWKHTMNVWSVTLFNKP